jgi:hypothetical protein
MQVWLHSFAGNTVEPVKQIFAAVKYEISLG